MHIQTHILSGWCVANVLELTPRERALAMVAASAADLDGLGVVVSLDAYSRYHHVLAHNLFFGILMAATLTAFCVHRWKAFFLFLGLFHLHLVMDYVGSGPGWGISYWWPVSDQEYGYRHAWHLDSWQNYTAWTALVVWMMVIALRQRRTPLENLLPKIDAEIVSHLPMWAGRKA